jgi:PIN domain nuclease of toxin-antitoxin system
MNYLLDSHAFLWFLSGDPRLSINAKSIIEDLENNCFLSTASVWEMAIKTKIGKLNPGFAFNEIESLLRLLDIKLLDLKPSPISKLFELDFLHNDPFDRMLICQAYVEDLALITSDKNISTHTLIKTLW